MLGH
jgi:hypothetical protein